MSSLINKLTAGFPTIRFQADNSFVWSPDRSTVFYPSDVNDPAQLLHELGHALKQHHNYQYDIQLLAMESEAWQVAMKLGHQYGVKIHEDVVQDHLDTYRDWLHARSRCPECEATGQQIGAALYICVACGQTWKVNEARTCQLKRYTKITPA